MCALGTESSLWNERDGNLFWLTKVLSVHQARKKKKVGHGREHFFIKKGDWYVNLIYYNLVINFCYRYCENSFTQFKRQKKVESKNSKEQFMVFQVVEDIKFMVAVLCIFFPFCIKS